MTQNLKASAQVGIGPPFAIDLDPDGVTNWPYSKLAWGVDGKQQRVDDVDGERLPVKPIGPRGALTDRHGSIAVGGANQQLAPANSNRNYLLVSNPSNAPNGESIWINFTSVAAEDNTSLEIQAGGSFFMSGPGFVSTEQVNVIASSTGHAYFAKEG